MQESRDKIHRLIACPRTPNHCSVLRSNGVGVQTCSSGCLTMQSMACARSHGTEPSYKHITEEVAYFLGV